MSKLRKIISELRNSFKALGNKVFAKLYIAETISLLGDAFTWVGLALLAYQFDKERSATILASALTLRVFAFIIFSPFAGVLSEKIDRKKILYVTHFVRMAIVGCLPFVKSEWQLYALVFALNIFNAFFTPTYRAIIPHVVDKAYYRQSVGLSTATFQILGVLGPGLAGILAVWFGVREIFFIDAVSFIIAALLILSIPGKALKITVSLNSVSKISQLKEVGKGIRLLFSNTNIRFALTIEFVSAIAGAQILVNTVGYVKNQLHLQNSNYGWVMAAFGIGAAIATFIAGSIDKSKSRTVSLIMGSLLLGISISLANGSNFPEMLLLWLVAGLGQSLAEMPSETLIGENIEEPDQGKVYGAHFAFSHLWWALAYPLAGFLGSHFPEHNFQYGGIITLVCLFFSYIFFKKYKSNKSNKLGNYNNPTST
jgi:MFS transporter, NRE family, putaive nickel resistance protein